MSTKTTAYGSITIVDITDIGEFSIYPMSNSPLSVVYDPNLNTYTPDWSLNNLVLEPMIYYAGTKLDSNTSGLSVVWKRKDGVGAESPLTTGETASGNKLTVKNNNLSTSASGILTYICTATYVEPESQATLTATGQITFSLIKHASNVKRCSITGENVFKYNTDSVLVGADYVTLTATTSNVSISKWQYKNSSGNWVDYPVTSGHNTSNTAETLKVYAAENVFVNDAASIKVTTSDNSIYDIYTVVKLRDGAAGANTVTAVLSNDDQWIACDSNYDPLNGAFNQAVSTITILEGGKDVTSEWTITCIKSGIDGNYDSDTHTYSAVNATEMPNVSANVQFKCEKTGYTTIYKNFSLTKLKAGENGDDAINYSITPNTLAVNKTIDGVHTPKEIVFTAHSTTGNNNPVLYEGRFEIYVNGSATYAYKSSVNESSCTYTLQDKSNVKSVQCILYPAGGSTATKLDTQTVVVTSDGATGATGDKGDKGDAAINVVLGNQADIIPCNNNGTVKSAMTLTIPFTGYVGTAKEACTVAVTGSPSGITVKKNTAGTSSASGTLELSVAAGSTLGNNDAGSITLTFTCKGSTVIHYYQWSKSIQALDGSNAVLFEIYAPTGNIIHNGENDVTLKARLMNGSAEVTDTLVYTWAKYESGTYKTISNVTTNTLTVEPADVNGYASYQCKVTYDGNERTAYYAVMDKTDPVQAQVHCSLGTQILNGQGYGAVYTKIYQNGTEIDTIKSEVFSTTAPSGPATGDFYYYLDTNNKTVTLKKYNGTTWENAVGNDLPKATYKYTFRDKDGKITTYNNQSVVEGKVFYIDGSFVTKKIIIDVEVIT
jgi:hypothetical protein